MDNTEKLIEKYKADMLNLSKKSIYRSEKVPVNTEKIKETAETENSDTDDKKGHFGFLKVMVFAGNEAFPVETARVEVFDKDGNELYSLLTDSGGIAEGMVLRTESEKENEYSGGKDGFSLYRLVVSHPDYETQIFDDVQIFENIESIQNVFFQTDDTFSLTGDEMYE